MLVPDLERFQSFIKARVDRKLCSRQQPLNLPKTYLVSFTSKVLRGKANSDFHESESSS